MISHSVSSSITSLIQSHISQIMASFLLSLLFLSTLLFSPTNAQNTVTLPLQKDSNTSQFFTTFHMGSNRAPINAVVDLGGPFLWFSCDDYASNTYAPIPCGSTKCSIAKGSGCLNCELPPRPGCTNNTCLADLYNPFTNAIALQGFGEDTFYAKNHVSLPEFSFSCMDNYYLPGLAAGTTGVLGLGRTEISLHKQAARKLNLPDRFSLCLPSSGIGKLTVGVRPYTMKHDIGKSLKTTALIINPLSTYPVFTAGDASAEYFIDVKSIYVDGTRLSVKKSYFPIKNGVGGTKISTVQNFTSVHSFIYKRLNRAFVKAASNMKIKRVASVAPFNACFSSDSIVKTSAGPSVPEIDLVLPENDVKWRLRGANLMVEIDEKTTCLAFVDDGLYPRSSIVIGVHQLEDNFLEFDLVSSKLWFSSSLLFLKKNCSHL